MRRPALLLPTLVAGLLGAGAAVRADPPTVHTSREGARVLPLPKEEGVFHFTVFGDRTGGPAEGIDVLDQAVRDVNLLGPDFVINVGDQVNGYNRTPEWLGQMREFRASMDRLEMPWFPVPGNHDVYWGGGTRPPPGHHERDYEKHFGPLWYWFGHKNAAFFALYSDEGDRARNRKGWGNARVNRFSRDQLLWLRQALREAKAYDHVFLFMHHPRWITDYYPGSNWREAHDLLVEAGNVSAVFAGHIHRRRYDGKHDGIEYFTLATTGGHIPFSVPGTGYLHHMNLVTVRQSGITVATLPVGAVLDPREMTPDRWQDVDRLRRLVPVVSGPGLGLKPTGAASGTYAFSLSNPTTRPIHLSTELRCDDREWYFAPSHAHLDLAPGATKAFEFTYSRAPGRVERLELPVFALQADYLGETQRISLPERSTTARWHVVGVPAALLSGKEDRAARLGGDGPCFQVANAALRVPDGPFTVEAWMKAEDLSGRRALLAKTESSEYGIFVNDGRPKFSVWLGAAYVTAGTDRRVLQEDRWHHVAGVYDGHEVRLFVDGEPVGRAPGSGTRRRNGWPLYVGADPDGRGRPRSTFHGAIDEVRVSRGARYADEAFEPARRVEPDEKTLLLLHLDGGLGPITPDHSKGERHALRVGNVEYR